MFKKAIALTAVLALPFSVVACGDNKTKTTPPAACDTTGYAKAGMAAKAAKRTFFTCGGEECELEYKVRRANGKLRKVENDMPTPREFTVPANAKSWKVEDCGDLYYRVAR